MQVIKFIPVNQKQYIFTKSTQKVNLFSKNKRGFKLQRNKLLFKLKTKILMACNPCRRLMTSGKEMEFTYQRLGRGLYYQKG